MTTPKNLHRLKAMMFLAGAIVAPFRLIHPSKGSQGAFTEAAIVGMTLLGFAAYYWFKFKQTSDKAVFYDITKQSPTKQIKISKRVIWMLAVSGTALSYWIYRNLAWVAAGKAATGVIWGPPAMLYNDFGFWPAVTCLPLLCLGIIGLCLFRIKKAKNSISACPTEPAIIFPDQNQTSGESGPRE